MFVGYTDKFPYSRVTERLAKWFPKWMKIARDPSSVGQQFLNVFGLLFEDVEDYLDAALDNQRIGTANLGEIDWIYKIHLPITLDRDDMPLMVAISDSEEVINLHLCPTLFEFYSEPISVDAAIVDYDEATVYFRKKYAALRVDGIDYTAIVPHHVWNVFDSFALLLGMRRRHLETNAMLKERILDIFRFPSNSTRIGLVNAIGRDLGLVGREIWPDEGGYHDTTIGNVIPETININGRAVKEFQIQALDNGNYRIFPRIKAFYDKDFTYVMDGVRIDSDKHIVLEDGRTSGYLITPILAPPNLKSWGTLTFTGDAEADVMSYDYKDIYNTQDAYIATGLSSGDMILTDDVTPAEVTEPIVLVIRLSRQAKTHPSPEVYDVALTYVPTEAQVSYIHNVTLNALHDDEFRNTLFNPDGSPSSRLLSYVDELNELVPIMWGRWKWDEGYWDVVGKDLIGLHVLPNKWDPQMWMLPSTYFQSGVGDGLDLKVKFDGNSWTPFIHIGDYYIKQSEDLTPDANNEVTTLHPHPNFIMVKDTNGKAYSPIAVNRNKITLPAPFSGVATVTYGAGKHVYAVEGRHTDPGPSSSTVLTDGATTPALAFPLQGEGLIVIAENENSNRVVLKQVAFLDENGQLSITNTERIVGNGTNQIRLTYGPAINVVVPGYTVQGVSDNVVTLTSAVPSGDIVEVSYAVKDSFIVDIGEGQTTITMSGTYTDISIYYEATESTTYRTLSSPSLDPLVTHLTQGFIYVIDELPQVASLRVTVHPDVIRANAIDPCIITVNVLDRYNNPVLGQTVGYDITFVTEEATPQEITPPGTLVKTATYYNRNVYKYVSPDPALIPDGSSPGRKIPCTAHITFSCGDASTTVSIKAR